ncbi:MAG: hypothetical protein MJ161_06805, partial [Clostridia bacterium]|nr:hypothetical protein [Clostridia bacterium]
ESLISASAFSSSGISVFISSIIIILYSYVALKINITAARESVTLTSATSVLSDFELQLAAGEKAVRTAT